MTIKKQHRIGQYLKMILGGFGIMCFVAVLFSWLGDAVDKEAHTSQVRADNGGVIPGKEAIDTKGRIYDVRTIHHNGNTYTCFTDDHRRLACTKE